jgi:hypothetical protein
MEATPQAFALRRMMLERHERELRARQQAWLAPPVRVIPLAVPVPQPIQPPQKSAFEMVMEEAVKLVWQVYKEEWAKSDPDSLLAFQLCGKAMEYSTSSGAQLVLVGALALSFVRGAERISEDNKD